MLLTAEEVRTSSKAVPTHGNIRVADRQKFILISFEQTLGVVWRTL